MRLDRQSVFAIVAMLLFAAGPARAQLSNETVDAAIQKHKDIRSQWDRCLMSSFVSEASATRNKALAAERAFASCRTEENLFINYLPSTIGVNIKDTALAAESIKADFKSSILK